MCQRLSKYITSFDYFDKSLIVLSITTGSISISSFAPLGIIIASFSLAFSISTGIIKKLLKTTRNKKKKHNKIVMLARSKLNSIESKISKTLIDNEISHDDFEIIKKKNIENWKKAFEWLIVIEVMLKKLVWLKKAKKVGINEVIKRNEIINSSLK